MSDRLLLVRHTAVTLVEGLAPAAWPASPEGVVEAERLAAAPVFVGLAALASSPERKALATAEPLARRFGLEIVVDEDLREVERPHGPIVPALEVQRRARLYLAGGLDGWERPEAARRRVISCIERLRREAPGPSAVVSHGLLLTLYRGGDHALWEEMPLPALAVGDERGIGPWLSVDGAHAAETQ